MLAFVGSEIYVGDRTLEQREYGTLNACRIADEREDGTVVRMQKAYPMYDEDWSKHVDTIRQHLAANLCNLQLVGRNGMHKYNNQDHSMITALYAARNICGADYDLWAVNTEPDYHEEKKEGSDNSSGQRKEPAYAEPARV